MKIVGVSRSEIFSPNSVAKDARIMEQVAAGLRQLGHTVLLMSEEEFVKIQPEADLIFTMARADVTLQILEKYQHEGCKVVNSVEGIRHSIRKPLTELLQEAGVPMPATQLIHLQQTVAADEGNDWHYPCWVKRGDACAQVRSDVSYVESPEESRAVLADFVARGIPDAVVSVHQPGDLVKFYGVLHTEFFSWNYPQLSKTKFGLEERNGAPRGLCFDVRALKQLADRAADVLDLPVYGGDCIITEEGGVYLIDFNDWPSFSNCTEKAGAAIVEYLMKVYEQSRT